MDKRVMVFVLLVVVIVTSLSIGQRVNTLEDKRGRDPYPSLNFEVDCSRLNNESQDDCQKFIYNMENVLYPKMKNMTGIDLRWCYDAVRITIYPKFDEGVRAGGHAWYNGSVAELSYLPKFSIDSPCKMHPHELQHAFDWCISNNYPLLEVFMRIGRLAAKNLCPEYEEEYNLASLVERRLIKERHYEIKDCLGAQANVIYRNTDEEFVHKFYEHLLRKKLGDTKTEMDITEAIIYASNGTDYYIQKYCIEPAMR